jgi:hypothetical protein
MAAAPCSWDISTSIGCCQDFWDSLTVAEQTAAAEAATFVLWAATGRQYGVCDQTVRPCGRWPCDEGTAGYYWSNGTWYPYILDGLWFNCPCGPDLCTCGARCKVYLPGPVASVSSVSVDGVVVDPSAYRVDDARWLIRTDGDCWPARQNFDVDSGVGTFSVTYGRGTAVPAYLLSAAGTYACEWAKMCAGADCQIPMRVVTLTRQGTTFDGVNFDQLLERGLTGVQSVDQIIVMANPHRLTGRLRIMSPEVTGPFQTTTP